MYGISDDKIVCLSFLSFFSFFFFASNDDRGIDSQAREQSGQYLD